MAQLIDRVRPFGIFILYGLVLTGGLTAIVEPIRRFLGNVLL